MMSFLYNCSLQGEHHARLLDVIRKTIAARARAHMTNIAALGAVGGTFRGKVRGATSSPI